MAFPGLCEHRTLFLCYCLSQLSPGLMGDEDLIRRLKKTDAKDFQTFVANLVSQMGLHAELQKFSGDGGVDVKATMETDLGKTVYGIQVKRYDKPVDVTPVREL